MEIGEDQAGQMGPGIQNQDHFHQEGMPTPHLTLDMCHQLTSGILVMSNMIGIYIDAQDLDKMATRVVLLKQIKIYHGAFPMMETLLGGKDGGSTLLYLFTMPRIRFIIPPLLSSKHTYRSLLMMRKILLMYFILQLHGCDGQAMRGKLLPHTETVLRPGDRITVNHPHGTLTVKAGKGSSRSFSGEDWKADRVLIPRKGRWNGSAGLYDPGASTTSHGRFLVEEGKQFFSTESEALRFLMMGSEVFRPVYTNQGLVIGYSDSKVPGGNVRSIRVWQIFIQGRKPTTLKGASDSLFSLNGYFAPEEANPSNVGVDYERRIAAEEYNP